MSRIKQLIDYKGINQKDFAKLIGVTQQYVSKLINETVGLGSSILEKIAIAYPEINLKWLLKLPNEDMLNNINAKTNFPNNGDLKKISVRFKKVPFVPIKAQAGFPIGFGDELYMDELDTVLWEIDDNEYKGNYIVFEVGGDSMNDGSIYSLLEGDRILCREIGQHLWRYKLHFNQWNFVLSHPENGIVVKRITDHNIETGILKCHSLNPYYEDFEVNINELSAIFNIVDIKRSARL